MTTTTTETATWVWDEERDSTFFRIVTHVFSPDFLAGAGVLLASFDTDNQ